MRHHRHTHLPARQAPAAHPVPHLEEATAADLIEIAQLRRLAATVLSKSPEDLAALAETNPLLVAEWIDAFRKEKLAAENEARYWSAAAASLSTATPDVVRAAAE